MNPSHRVKTEDSTWHKVVIWCAPASEGWQSTPAVQGLPGLLQGKGTDGREVEGLTEVRMVSLCVSSCRMRLQSGVPLDCSLGFSEIMN